MSTRLLVVVADGVRPDVLREEMDAGQVPALASLAERGGLHTVSASFPSVTGPAYVPFIMGRNPADVGLPGLRWFDRTRRIGFATGNARSYSGTDIWYADHDVSRDAPTLLELARPSLAGMTMLARGASLGNVGRGPWWAVRAFFAHFRGDIMAWRTIEQHAITGFLARFARERPRTSVLSVTSPDKFAHAYGSRSAPVRAAVADIDGAVARARAIARDGGWGDSLHVWVVGDHGHAPVEHHDDLHAWLDERGHRTAAHPRVGRRDADVALMVGGNAMAQLYLDPSHRERSWWPAHESRWGALHDALVSRRSVDLVAVAVDAGTVRVSSDLGGSARIGRRETPSGTRWDYDAEGGDPLGLGGTLRGLDHCSAWQVCAESPYPDALVQLVSLVTAKRSGDVILSASAGWDLRARFEPVPHVSTHGPLLQEQMHVPLLLDAPPSRPPMRTTDVVPSALALLGITTEHRFDGRSFV